MLKAKWSLAVAGEFIISISHSGSRTIVNQDDEFGSYDLQAFRVQQQVCKFSVLHTFHFYKTIVHNIIPCSDNCWSLNLCNIFEFTFIEQ